MIHRLFPAPNAGGEWLSYCGQSKYLMGRFDWLLVDDGVDCNVCKDQIRRFKAPQSVTAPSDYVLQD